MICYSILPKANFCCRCTCEYLYSNVEKNNEHYSTTSPFVRFGQNAEGDLLPLHLGADKLYIYIYIYIIYICVYIYIYIHIHIDNTV